MLYFLVAKTPKETFVGACCCRCDGRGEGECVWLESEEGFGGTDKGKGQLKRCFQLDL